MRRHILISLVGALAGTLIACGGDGLFPPNEQLVAALDGQPGPVGALSGQQLGEGVELLAVANANLRREPSTSGAVLMVVPRDGKVKLLEGAPRDGFYRVAFGGLQGWTYGAHYTESLSVMTLEQELSSSDIIKRASTVVGFSYWWGHGVWNPGSTSHGSCSGSCGACSHSGSYGADCSGMVAKAWQVPSSNTDYTVDAHPYSTYDFDNTTVSWDPVSRDSIQPGDAFVYNEDGAGHIFIYEKGDPWGSMWAYECKGCAYGCVHNVRTASSYKAIRRRGLTAPSGATSDPTSVSWSTGRLDVFVRGSDNALWHSWYDSGTWYGWQSLGGILTSGPDAASWGDGRIDVFARDTNNNIVQKYYISGSGWSPWMQQGAPPGGASSDPSVVTWSTGRLDVFVRGSDNALWHKWYDNGTWYAWQSLGGVLTSAPDAASDGVGRLDVFARDTSNRVVQKYYSGGNWSAWVVRGSTATSAPGAVSWGPDRIDVFARGADNSLIHQYWTGSAGWSAWISEGGILTSGPDVSSWGAGRLDVVARNTNNDIVHKWFVSGTGWSAWENLGSP